MGKKEQLMQLVNSHHGLFSFLTRLYNRANLRNRLPRLRDGNSLEMGVCTMKNVQIHIRGKNNRIVIGDFARLQNTHIGISGSNNTIIIGQRSYLNEADLWIENDGGAIILGEHTGIYGSTHLAVLEGTKITIGDDCLFSSDIHFRTGDSHSVTDLAGNRINPSEDITIGSHVWIGTKVICLKGVSVADNCIAGAGAVLCRHYDTPNCALGGNPARVIKTGVNWTIEKLKV